MLAVRKQRQVICKVCGTCACVNDNSIACEPVVRLETSGGGGNISENKGSYRVDVTTSVRSPDYEYEAMLITTIIWLFFPCNWWNCGTPRMEYPIRFKATSFVQKDHNVWFVNSSCSDCY